MDDMKPEVVMASLKRSSKEWCRAVIKKVGADTKLRSESDFVDLSGAGKKHDAVKMAFLESGQGSVRLRLHPADTAEQAQVFYKWVKPVALSDLSAAGWTVTPNLHFGFWTTGLPPRIHHPPCGLEKYVVLWMAQQRNPKGYIRGVRLDEWNDLLAWLVREGLVANPSSEYTQLEAYLKQ
jgi:hypothetical protein